MKISDKSFAFRHLGFPKKKIKFSSLQLLVQMLRNLFNQLTEMTFFMYLIFGIWPSKLNKLLKTKMCFENEHGLFWYVTEILNAIPVLHLW